jgi:hypothetical protein
LARILRDSGIDGAEWEKLQGGLKNSQAGGQEIRGLEDVK